MFVSAHLRVLGCWVAYIYFTIYAAYVLYVRTHILPIGLLLAYSASDWGGDTDGADL